MKPNEDPRRFVVAPGGEASELDVTAPEHEPDAESRRRAKIMAQAGNFDAGVEDLFAQGIAVGRAGGDVEAFVRQWADANRPKR